MQGPVFAIIGAWVIHQIQNKDVIAKDVSESMYQKAIIATALSSILSHFCPIDDWLVSATGLFSYLQLRILLFSESSQETSKNLMEIKFSKHLMVKALHVNQRHWQTTK